jgi:hypothetical protein
MAMIERIALIGVTVIGMAFCSRAIGKVAADGAWASLPGVAGAVLGVAILGVVGARLLGRPMPFVESDTAAIAALLEIAAVKVGVAALFRIA